MRERKREIMLLIENMYGKAPKRKHGKEKKNEKDRYSIRMGRKNQLPPTCSNQK